MQNDDLISRSAAIEQIERREKLMTGDKRVGVEHFKIFLMNRPTVDAVEVVRCKDCRHTVHSRIYPEVLICTLTKMCGETDPEFFCANGEMEVQDG